ncbi:MAG TPA: calcium-binding protein, partial [Thermoleophilaceae bacterium]|nr:calcium-binding protein [Thermoleophilaceae bacterium]
DRLYGGRGDDTLTGNPGLGKDRMFGGPGNDNITGGAGPDRLHGGDGNDVSNGGNGNDLMSGGKGDDQQHGGMGNDRIFANLGVDESWGDDGNDDLWAMARGDVQGPNDTTGDTLHGGNGNDTFHVRDGEADNIDCGDGNDRVIADFADVIMDATPTNPNGSCEQVIRKAPKTGEDRAENKYQSPREDKRTH